MKGNVMNETAAVETVSETTSNLPIKMIVAGVAITAVGFGIGVMYDHFRKARKNKVEETTVITPDDFIPANPR